MKKIILLLILLLVGFNLSADYGLIDGSKLMYNYFQDFIADSTLGTNSYGRIDGEIAFYNSFITWIEWADTVGSTVGFPVDFITARDSGLVTIQDDVVIDSNLTVTGTLTVSGSNITDSISTNKMAVDTLYLDKNNTYVQGKNSGGTYSNVLKLNASDVLEYGVSQQVGQVQFGTNAGDVTYWYMPITSDSPDGTSHSLSFMLGDKIPFTMKCLSDGAGAVDTVGVEINGFMDLDSLATDPDSLAGRVWYGGGDDSLHIWTNAGKMTSQLLPSD